ncbi:MAG: winged helix-turn-helix domain-containing protein [Promethearchaeota archaeon]
MARNKAQISDSAKDDKNSEIPLSDQVETESGKEELLYLALGHEVRRSMLKIIGTQGFVGFSALKNQLKVSTGTIYHHLKILADLITQDKQKKYHLSPLGMHAYRMLQQNLDSIGSVQTEKKLLMDRSIRKLSNIGLLKPVFRFFIQNFRRSVFFASGIVFLVALLSAIFGVQAFLNIYLPLTPQMEIFLLGHPIIQFVSVIVGYCALFLIIEGLSRLLFHKKDNSGRLFIMISISFIPLIVYILIIGILRSLPIGSDAFLIISRVFLILFQVWVTILLAYCISAVKYVKFERGLIIVIFIDYGMLMLLLLLNSPLI